MMIKARSIYSIIFVICLLSLLSLVIVNYSIHTVVGESMVPTLHDGDVILVRKVKKELHNGDVIVFNSKKSSNSLIKRILSTFSDTIILKGNQICVQGTPEHINWFSNSYDQVEIEEAHGKSMSPFIRFIDSTIMISNVPNPYSSYPDTIIVPAHSIYVIGDNLNKSNDSRNFGLVAKEDIKGVLVRKLSFLTNSNKR